MKLREIERRRILMRFVGRVFKAGKYWAVEVPILGVVTQGRSRKDAQEMIADAIESLVNEPNFKVQTYMGKGGYFEVGAEDQAALTALLLRRERLKSGLSLSQVAARLGAKSLNAYARYEQGRATPTIQKLSQLYSAVASNGDFVVTESAAPQAGRG
jgi:predicted RNase H-like HicB family nuclease